MKKIYLLTGPKNSGKSTRLLHWSKKQKNIHGIICPREKGKRELYSIYSKRYYEFEVYEIKRETIQIGKYKFLKESFRWAENEILTAEKLKPQWIIIDEIGPLELQGLGFNNITNRLLENKKLIDTNLLLVIRDSLLEEVIRYYNLNKSYKQIVDFI